MKKFLFFILIVCLTGCEEILFKTEDSDSAEVNFESFWKNFDLHYSYFIYKNINWDSIYNQYRDKITENTTEEKLFKIFNEICPLFDDGHVQIFASIGYISGTPTRASYIPDNWVSFAKVNKYYLFNSKEYGTLIAGKILQQNIGYIRVSSFSGDIDEFETIDEIVNEYFDTDGIIIDVRENGGGNDYNSETIFGRFADKSRLYRKTRYRNGKGYNDFSDWSSSYTKILGSKQYLNPVIVLTNRQSASSTEDFISAMQTFPHVTIVGDTTSGATGNPLVKELPNGWILWLSNWQAVNANMEYIEDVGIYPDIPVWTSDNEMAMGNDKILDTAISIILNQVKK